MSTPLLGALAAALASLGTYLIYTSVALGWRGFRPLAATPRYGPSRSSASARDRLVRAGLGEVSPSEFAAAVVLLWVVGAVVAFALFGGVIPAVVAGCFAGSVPLSSYRARRRDRMVAAGEAWPRLLEELRLLTGSMGRSVPQALFEVGRHAPHEWRAAFAAAEREWLLTTDFRRTTALLKDRLADPTVDAVCETLEVAHEVGGSDLESRLADLIDDRVLDQQGRKDAASRQAGVRFARRFVLLVPLGMALAGLSIGTGRHAYATAGGQTAVLVGLVSVMVCWVWSGWLMRMPNQARVFQ